MLAAVRPLLLQLLQFLSGSGSMALLGEGSSLCEMPHALGFAHQGRALKKRKHKFGLAAENLASKNWIRLALFGKLCCCDGRQAPKCEQGQRPHRCETSRWKTRLENTGANLGCAGASRGDNQPVGYNLWSVLTFGKPWK